MPVGGKVFLVVGLARVVRDALVLDLGAARGEHEFCCLVPQAPGAAHPGRLASSHKLGRAVALAGFWSKPEPFQAVS